MDPGNYFPRNALGQLAAKYLLRENIRLYGTSTPLELIRFSTSLRSSISHQNVRSIAYDPYSMHGRLPWKTRRRDFVVAEYAHFFDPVLYVPQGRLKECLIVLDRRMVEIIGRARYPIVSRRRWMMSSRKSD